jgi:hypothetical protein
MSEALVAHLLETLRHHKEYVAGLERDRDALLASLMSMAPGALESLTSEERRQVKMLNLRVLACLDGSLKLSGAFGESSGICNNETVSAQCSGLGA